MEDPRYPETKILGTGAFSFVEHVMGQSWEGRRFEGYFQPGLPYLDGFKAFFVKSTGLATGIIGGQFDVEFRGLTPATETRSQTSSRTTPSRSRDRGRQA